MADSPELPTLLHYLLLWEQRNPQEVYLTQPMPDGSVVRYTWRDVADQARRMANHLLKQRFPPGSLIAIIGNNCAHWIIADLAIWIAGHVSVPVYPGIDADTLEHVLAHSEARLLFAGRLDSRGNGEFGRDPVSATLPHGLPVITLPSVNTQQASAVPGAQRWDEIVCRTAPVQAFALPDPKSLATVIYTSGTTGRPKGVMHSFGTMCGAPSALSRFVSERSIPTQSDRMLSYLPLSHCAERHGTECASLRFGFQLFFCDRADTFLADLQRARPTIFLSVPYVGIRLAQFANRRIPPLLQEIALAVPLLSGLMRRKLLRAMGLADVRIAYIGSAAVPAYLLRWYRRLGLELLEGYGMTENFGYSHFNTLGSAREGYVGKCFPDVQCRIAPDGEILVKSPAQMLGYYKDPDLTADSLTPDGFFKTGDRGYIYAQACLRITGRMNDPFKTAKGTFVNPAPIETSLTSHPWIEAACVTGAGRTQPFALLMLNQAGCELVERGARAAVARTLEQLRQRINTQLPAHERLEMMVVVRKRWSVQGGDMTPSLKIRRASIEDRHLWKADSFASCGNPIVFE